MEVRSAVSSAVTAGAILGLLLAGLNLPTTGEAAILSAVPTRITDIVRWDIPVVRNQPVQRFVELFEKQQTDRMALYLKRSGRYEGMIRTKLREEGMPEDLLYLSMIESGFNPNARSKAEAVGLWQFVAGTARMYGLRVDSYVDERRDPERSTDAAIRYLQDLHNRFGSWNLAAAAYNTGENRIARIMKEETGLERGVESDFWRIRSRLPAETREYVPLMFAAALIGKEPHKYGLDRVERLLPVEVVRVSVPGGTSLANVAASIGMTAPDLMELNPHILRGVTPPGAPYSINLPEDRVTAFSAAHLPPVLARTFSAPAP